MYDPYSQFEKVLMSNGLTVYHQYWNRPWVGVYIVVHAGAREDPTNLPGLAHFLEHCVSNNIQGYTKAKARDFLEEAGGNGMFGATSYLSTEYSFYLPVEADQVLRALQIFGSMTLQAKITKRIEKERLIIKQEFGRAYPIPQNLEWLKERHSNLFKGHRLENYNGPLGTLDGFMSAKKQDLQSFYDQYYTPANMSLVVLGGFTQSEFLSLLAKSPFVEEKSGERNPVVLPMTELLPEPVTKLKVVTMSELTLFKLSQLKYTASWTLPGNINFEALQATREILDHFLKQVIREEIQGSYHFSSDFRVFQDVYLFEISGEVDPRLADSINDVVLRCLKKVMSGSSAFKKIKKNRIKRLLMNDLSGHGLVKRVAGDLEFDQEIETLKQNIEKREDLKFHEVRKVVELLYPERQYTFIVRP